MTASESTLRMGDVVVGRVISHHPFGVFVDIGRPCHALIVIAEFKDPGERMSPAEYPAIGEAVTAVVMHVGDGGQKVRLSARPSDLTRAAEVGRTKQP